MRHACSIPSIMALHPNILAGYNAIYIHMPSLLLSWEDCLKMQIIYLYTWWWAAGYLNVFILSRQKWFCSAKLQVKVYQIQIYIYEQGFIVCQNVFTCYFLSVFGLCFDYLIR